jgi:hypothetical protein
MVGSRRTLRRASRISEPRNWRVREGWRSPVFYPLPGSASRNNCWDNAPMESVNGTLKVECVNDVHLPDAGGGAASDRRVHRLLQYRAAPFLARQHCTGGIRAALARRYRTQRARPRAREAPRYPPTAGSRFRRKRPNRPSVDNAHRALWRPPNGDRFIPRKQLIRTIDVDEEPGSNVTTFRASLSARATFAANLPAKLSHPAETRRQSPLREVST